MPTNRDLRLELEAKTGLSLPPGTEILDDHLEGIRKGKNVLLPVPANDPADPLNWSKAWKALAYFLALAYVFLECYPALVISLFYAPLGMEFNVGANKLSYLTGIMVLLLGVGNLLFIPFAACHGRRTAMTVATLLCSASFSWQALAKSYGSMMGGRALNGLGACLIESIGPMVIEDLFFVHERGTMNGLYFGTLFASTGFGPFVASFFAQYTSWRNFFWLSCATSMVLQIALVFFPETKYHRTTSLVATAGDTSALATKVSGGDDSTKTTDLEATVQQASYLGRGKPPRAAFGLWTPKRAEETYAWEFATPFLLLQFPICVWPSFLFMAAAVCPLFISIIQAILYGAPPYSFSIVAVGATNWVTVVGNLLGALAAGLASDYYMAWRAKRNSNVREAEHRLPVLIPFVLCLVLGLASLGISASRANAWPVPVIVATGLNAIGVTGTAVIALAYGIDAYSAYAGQLLTLATIVKNVVAFGIAFGVVDWVIDWGWERAMGLWAGVMALIAVAGVPLYFYGKRLRELSATSKLMRDE
ncbi:hypothetical protein JCM10207_005400 [Rhodosporidiobolus poonsookiae]